MRNNKYVNTRGVGYYTLTIKADSRQYTDQIIFSNSERAFIIAILQDCLGSAARDSPSNLGIAQHLHTAHYTDLLGFSITRSHISLVAFSLSRETLRSLGAHIINKLCEFQENEHTSAPKTVTPRLTINRLPGPHMALHSTLLIHAQHTDWEYDRYSSIGFYLHERRGDWMRLWRMVQLYEGDPSEYRRLLMPLVNQNRRLTPSTSLRK